MDILFNIVLCLGYGAIAFIVFLLFDIVFGLMDWLRNNYIIFRVNKHKHPFLWWNEHCTITFRTFMDDAVYYYQLNNGKWIKNDTISYLGGIPHLFHNGIAINQIKYVAVMYKNNTDLLEEAVFKMCRNVRRIRYFYKYQRR